MSFYTEVIALHPRFHDPRRVRAMRLLEPVTRKAIRRILRDAAAEGLQFEVYETYRSQARQANLFQDGRTQIAVAGVHHFGLACDLVRVVDGRLAWDADHGILFHLGRRHGLVWGGNWGDAGSTPPFVDVYHLQRCAVRQQDALFAHLWYPDDEYDPYSDHALFPPLSP